MHKIICITLICCLIILLLYYIAERIKLNKYWKSPKDKYRQEFLSKLELERQQKKIDHYSQKFKKIKNKVTTKETPPNQVIYFKDVNSAFNYACKYSNNKIKTNQGIIAMVIDIMPSPNDNENPHNNYLIKVADNNNGFMAISTTTNKHNQSITKNDLVIWVPYEYFSDTGWAGFIRATVYPELSTKKGWKIKNKF